MSKPVYIFESILDDLGSVDNDIARNAARDGIERECELRPPGKDGWQNVFTIQLVLDISGEGKRLDLAVEDAVRLREHLYQVLQSTLWLDEYSEVWICSGMTDKDYEHNGVIIHKSEDATKASMTFSINGRPRNTRECLYFILSVIQSVRPAYDKDDLFPRNDYLMVKWRDDTILNGWNMFVFQNFGELYYLMTKQLFLHEWTRDGSKGNYPWTVFKHILQIVCAIMPGRVEPYQKIKRMFENIHIDMRPEHYELIDCEGIICTESFSQGVSGEIKLPMEFRKFFLDNPLNISALRNAPYNLRNTGYALICKTVSSYNSVEGRLYEFAKPEKNIALDNSISKEQVEKILDECDGQRPRTVWLRLFKKSHNAFIALHLGTFALSEERAPYDIYVGVRRDIGMSQQAIMNHQMYSNGPEKWKEFVDEFCDSLNLLYDGKLPDGFRDYFDQTILKKY